MAHGLSHYRVDGLNTYVGLDLRRPRCRAIASRPTLITSKSRRRASRGGAAISPLPIGHGLPLVVATATGDGRARADGLIDGLHRHEDRPLYNMPTTSRRFVDGVRQLARTICSRLALRRRRYAGQTILREAGRICHHAERHATARVDITPAFSCSVEATRDARKRRGDFFSAILIPGRWAASE